MKHSEYDVCDKVVTKSQGPSEEERMNGLAREGRVQFRCRRVLEPKKRRVILTNTKAAACLYPLLPGSPSTLFPQMHCFRNPLLLSSVVRLRHSVTFSQTRSSLALASKKLLCLTTRPTLHPLLAMAPKQATLGYVKPSQRTLGCVHQST